MALCPMSPNDQRQPIFVVFAPIEGICPMMERNDHIYCMEEQGDCERKMNHIDCFSIGTDERKRP